jgi:hypothetical protein
MKLPSCNTRTILSETISFLYILLFVYAGVSKLIEFQNFQAQLGQSPMLSAFAVPVSYMVIVTEFAIAIGLALRSMQLASLYAAYTMMILFTAYIIIILNYSSFIPCSCGGILEKMGWDEHLVFNIVFALLALVAITIMTANKRRAVFGLSALTVCGSILMASLFLASEDVMQHRNPFIRRYEQGTTSMGQKIDLANTSFYFAGEGNGSIYLGNIDAPLWIMEVDSHMNKQLHKIEIDDDDYPFRAVHVKITAPFFILYDGTVPVLFKGRISDWKATKSMSKDYYFAKAAIGDSKHIAFRAQDMKTHENILGLFSFEDSLKVKLNSNLLQRQIDGRFDTDGMLLYNEELQRYIYTYYYRNEFIICDKDLQLVYRGKTIDTTSRANIKVVYIKSKGERKMSAPPYTVNLRTATSNKLLFVNSGLMGRFEDAKEFNSAEVIDVYNLEHNTYQSSFKIPKIDGRTISDFMVTDSCLYTITGRYLQKFKLTSKLIKHKTHLPASSRKPTEHL